MIHFPKHTNLQDLTPVRPNLRCFIVVQILTAGSAKKEMPRSAKPADSNLPSQVRGVLSP